MLRKRNSFSRFLSIARRNAKPQNNMKNRYKAIRGKSQIFVVAKNISEAEIIARPLLKAPCATIKIQYVGHA